jgi:hypothetical protein
MVVQFELPGEHTVALVKAPFASPAGFDDPPPALMDITLLAGPAIELFPGVVVLLLEPPHPRDHVADSNKAENSNLGTPASFVLCLLVT